MEESAVGVVPSLRHDVADTIFDTARGRRARALR